MQHLSHRQGSLCSISSIKCRAANTQVGKGVQTWAAGRKSGHRINISLGSATNENSAVYISMEESRKELKTHCIFPCVGIIFWGGVLNSSFGAVFLNLTIWNSSHPVQLENDHNSHLLYEKFAKYSPRKLWLIHHQNHQKIQPKCLKLSLVNVWQPTLKKCHNIFKNPNPLNAWSLFPQAFLTYQNMFSLPIYIFSCTAFLN